MVQVVARNKRKTVQRSQAVRGLRALRWWRIGALCVLLAACAWPHNPTLREPAGDPSAPTASSSNSASASTTALTPATPSVSSPAIVLHTPPAEPSAASASPTQAQRSPAPVSQRHDGDARLAAPARSATAVIARSPSAAQSEAAAVPAVSAEPSPPPQPAASLAAAPAEPAAAPVVPTPATPVALWQWPWLLWALLLVLAVIVLMAAWRRRRPSRQAPPAPRAKVSPSIRWAKLAPDAGKVMLKPPVASVRPSVSLRDREIADRRMPRRAIAVAPVALAADSLTSMEHPHVPREPLPPPPQSAVAAPVDMRAWDIDQSSMTLQIEWSASQGEQMIWQDWMEPAPVDMGDGCVLVHEREALASAPAPLEQAAPEVAPVPVPVPVAETVVAVAGPVQAGPAAPPAAVVAPVQQAAPAAPVLPFARRVQALLDDTAGPGLFRVEVAAGSEAPQLRLLVATLPVAASSALFKGIALMNSPELARWLQAQVALASRFEVPGNKPERVYEHAVELTLAPAQVASPNAADWQALRIQLHLAWLQQQGRASRLLGLSRMRQALGELDQRDALPVQLVWLQVLQWWGSQQQGAAGLQRYDEAQALCAELATHPEMEHESQRLLAETLLLRSRQEIGGIREASLRRAADLAAQVHAQTHAPAAALSVASIALARAELAAPGDALPLLEQALAHAFLAGQDPALEAASLQARLAIQLAYEALVNEPAPQQVAQDLAERLQGTALLAAETWRRIVDVYLRREQFQQACQVAAQAARQHRLRPDLIALWERASAAWKAQGLRDGAQTAWQENVRARQAASAQV